MLTSIPTRSAAILLAACGAASAQPVRVILDMDAAAPGIQDTIQVPHGTTLVRNIAVYIYDPAPTPRSIRGIGYLGGLDRGIAIGHHPTPGLVGSVTSITGQASTPIVTDSTHYVTNLVDKGFGGPELHYVESLGSLTPLPSAPTTPVFTVDVHLQNAATGDDFRIFLLDMVTVWRGQSSQLGGAFTISETSWLDTGGDSVPDGTLSLFGPDPDFGISVPPAAFEVDYIDSQTPGNGGGGRILVGGCYPDCDGVGGLTAGDFICFLGAFANGSAYANCDGSTAAPVLTANDFVCFLTSYTTGCS